MHLQARALLGLVYLLLLRLTGIPQLEGHATFIVRVSGHFVTRSIEGFFTIGDSCTSCLRTRSG